MRSFVDWIEEEGFWVRESYSFQESRFVGTGFLELEPRVQRRILEHCLTPDPDTGELPYHTIVFSAIKKSGKSALGAAITTWYAEEARDGTELFSIANSKEQAAGRITKDIKFHIAKRNQLRDREGKKLIKVTKDKIEFPNETTIETLAQNYAAAAGSRHALTVWDELWGFCEEESILAYTREGWKSWKELCIGEEIATINVDTGEYEWQKTSNVSAFTHQGELIKLDHRRIQHSMTANHKVIGRFRTSGHKSFGSLELVEARDACNYYEMLQPTSSWTGVPSGYSLAQLKLFGLYLAEGWKDHHRLFIAQEVPVKAHKGNVCDIISELLIDCGLPVEYDGHRFIIRRTELTRWLFELVEQNELIGSHNKHIPARLKDILTEELDALFIGYMLGDGWKAGSGWQTETISSQLHLDLQEIGVKLGYYVKDMGKRNKGGNCNDIYRSSYSIGNIRIDRRNWKRVEYDGVVWCPTVPNGTWLAKNGDTGHIFWTGNTLESEVRLWDEMTPIPTVPNSLRVVVTYAGIFNESMLLWDLYINGVGKDEYKDGKGKRIPGLEDLPCWENNGQFTYWDHDPRMPWQTPEYYENQANSLRPHAYLRLHENRWVDTHETFIPLEWWDFASTRLEGPADQWMGHPYSRHPIIIGVDASTKHDSTAVVGVTLDKESGNIAQVFHRIWQPRPDSIFDLDKTVGDYIIRMSKLFHIRKGFYDPKQLHQPMIRVRSKGVPMEEFTQSATNMTKATSTVFDMFKYKNFMAYPDDEIKSHIRNALVKEESNGFRLVKDKTSKVIRKPMDYCIALAIAAHMAVNMLGRTGSAPIVIESPFSDMSTRTAMSDKERALPWMMRND